MTDRLTARDDLASDSKTPLPSGERSGEGPSCEQSPLTPALAPEGRGSYETGTSHGATPRVPQQALDRLVDGDLPPGERHRLLAALADEPGGWQRCALAFLEAQSWRRACRELVAEPGNGSRDPEVSPARPRSRHFFQRRGDLVRLSASIAAGAVVLGVVFCGGLAAGRAWPASSPLMAGERSSQTGANPDGAQGSMRTAIVGANRNSSDGNRKHARTVVQLLGIIHVPGEDGARLAVPILAAPGLKVDPPPRQPGTLAAGHRSFPSPGPRHGIPSESSSLDGEPLTLPLLAGQRVAIPADWVNALAQGPSVH